MPEKRGDEPLPNLLQRTHDTQGNRVLYRFGNGLALWTEIFRRNDKLRILPLGTPQGALMNHMLNFPEIVRGKWVFEPFAGSGALGFMALSLGANHVDFLDINPRAASFQSENAALNQFSASTYRPLVGDIASFAADCKYHLVVANPPFVPTPTEIEGMITSNGGPDGNKLVELLLKRLEEILYPDGQALIYLFQLVSQGEPLVVKLIRQRLGQRTVELTPSQARPIGFEVYCQTYSELFPEAAKEIARWKSDLIATYGDGLMLSHYIAHIGPQAASRASCTIRDNFREKYGEDFLVPSGDDKDLSYARICENILDFDRMRG